MKRIIPLFCYIIGMLYAVNAQAQTGYIYVHKKTLSEDVSVPFSFNVSGGPTSVAAFNLNDNTTYLNVLDIGASHTTSGTTVVSNGQLWAVTDQKGLPNALNVSTGVPHYDGGEIYMRPAGSSQWVTTGQTGINIDGAGPNQLFYTNSSKDAYYYAFGGSANRIWGQANHGGHGLIDIGVGFPSVTAGIRDDGHLMVYTGNYTNGSDTWNDLTPGGANLSRVDVDATSGQIVTQGSDYVIRVFPTNGNSGFTTLPLPPTAPFSTYDVTVDDNGQIYAIYFAPSGVNVGPAIYRYNSGSMTWTFEPGSANFAAATASGTQVWGVNQKGLASNARTIFARVTDGSIISYIDDERVRPAGTADNSILIPVAVGTYTLTEGAVSGWDLNAITLYDPTNNSTKDVATNTSVLNVAAGEVVHVVYSNERVTTVAINNSCATQYIETFGSGTATYAPPVAGITPYHYVADKHPEDGYYTIEQDGTGYINSASAPTQDHTPASVDGANPGYFMLVDAGLAQDEYYRKRITGLVVGQSYTLSFWAADAAPGFPARPDVTFGIADVNSGVFINSVSTGQMSNTYWKQYQFSFTATNTTGDLVLRNNTTGVYGNDIFIDDITLNGTPAPITAIAGPATTCSIPSSSTYAYTNTTSGGVWSVLPASMATINASTGVLTTVANASGTATVTYTVNTGGCESTATLDIVVSNTNCTGTSAGTGYIYVHKKTLNEESSPNFTFNVTGGSVNANYTLNDQPAFNQIQNIGADAKGGIYVTAGTADGAGNYPIYFRAINSPTWVAYNFNAKKVEGAEGNGNALAVATVGGVGNVYVVATPTGPGATFTQITNIGGSSNIGNVIDVASNHFDRLYALTSDGKVWQAPYTNTAGWAQVPGVLCAKAITAAIGAQPGCGCISQNGNSVLTFNYDGSSLLNRGAPAGTVSSGLKDVAFNGNGQLFAAVNTSLEEVYAYNGSSWVSELPGQAVQFLTGGPDQTIWGAFATANSLALTNIYTRADANNWLDDERARIGTNDNSVLIPVAAGTYTVSESPVSGWALSRIDIVDPSGNTTGSVATGNTSVNVAAGEVVHVTYQNTLIQTTPVVNTCGATTYTENFGTGAVNSFGTTPFTGQTAYHFRSSAPLTYGYYTTLTNSSLLGSYAGNFNDHTTGTGTGRFFYVDASYTKDEFFRRRFTGLVAGAQYTFSAWVINVHVPSPGLQPVNVLFQAIDPTTGVTSNSVATGDITALGVWQKATFTFTAGAQGSLDLVMRNNANGGQGNDLGIDDITFSLAGSTQPVVASTAATCSMPGSLTVTDPTGPSLEYSVNGTTYQASPVFSNLTAGTYSVTARYTSTNGCTSPPTSITINAAICGNVLNDVNALTDNTVNGTGVDGTVVPVYVSLVQSGSVVATVPVTSTGAYSFTNVPNGTYSVVLTTNPAGSTTPSLPASYTYTGENIGTAAGSDGTPNGILAVTVNGASVSNANLGIEQPPVAGSGMNTVSNGGGTTPVPVPTSTFTNTAFSTDTAPGSVTAIRITAFPSNTTSLTVNGTVYTASTFPAGGVVVPTDGNGSPTVPILVDPTNDANPVSIPFKAIDNAGIESANTGTAVLNFTTPAGYTISGNVLNDVNALTDNIVNGPGVNGTALLVYVSLVQSGSVVATVPVTSTGAYSFTNVPNGTYSVVLTTNPAGSTTPGLPASYTYTGENIGTAAGSDGTPNGILAVTVNGASVTNANLGIEQPPVAGSGMNTVSNGGGTTPVPVPTNTFTNTAFSTDTAPGSVTAIRITAFPSNTTSLTVNGTVYTASTFPAGGVVVPTDGSGNPTVPILVDPTNDANPVSIPFKAIDNAGIESANTGTAVLNFTGVPDLTPTIYALPSTVYNTTDVTVVVDVDELLSTPTSGLITLRLSKDAKVSLTFPPSATMVGGRSVQNTQWSVDASSSTSYYVLTTTQVIGAGGRLSFGFTGTLTPGATTGALTVSTVIMAGSGGEVRFNNNVDSDKIDYFQQ